MVDKVKEEQKEGVSILTHPLFFMLFLRRINMWKTYILRMFIVQKDHNYEFYS